MEHTLAGIFWRLAGVLALVFANGFFVAAEFAIVTVRKTRIDQLIAEGSRSARTVRRAITDPTSYIAATQLGITMASLRSEEHTSELQSLRHLVCRLLLEK